MTVTTACASNSSAEVAITAATATITASGPTTFCEGQSVTLTASTGASWLWSNGATTQAIVVTASGEYIVTVTDANGCDATAPPVTVTVNPVVNGHEKLTPQRPFKLTPLRSSGEVRDRRS